MPFSKTKAEDYTRSHRVSKDGFLLEHNVQLKLSLTST